MSETYNNTAGRLHTLFKYAKSRSSMSTAHEGWGDVFGLELLDKGVLRTDALAELYSKLAMVQLALRQVEDEVHRHLPGKAELLLRGFPSLKRAAAPVNLAAGWIDSCVNHITSEALYGLEICAHELPVDGVCTGEELKDLADTAADLFAQVSDSDIDNDLKTWLLELVSSIKRSVDDFFIFGAEGLRDTIAQVIGELCRYRDAVDAVKTQSPTVWQRFVDMVAKLNAAAEKAEKFKPLLTMGGQLLSLVLGNGKGVPLLGDETKDS